MDQMTIGLPFSHDMNGKKQVRIFFQKGYDGLGFDAELHVWVNCTDSLSEMQKDSIGKTKMFLSDIIDELELLQKKP
jgi:hypothetical protein